MNTNKSFNELERRQFHAAVESHISRFWFEEGLQGTMAALENKSLPRPVGSVREQCDRFLSANAPTLMELLTPNYDLARLAADFVVSRNTLVHPNLKSVSTGFQKLKAPTGQLLHASAVGFGIAVPDDFSQEAKPTNPFVRF